MGAPGDSCVVGGVVGRKNVTHKAMRRRIARPRVLLLGGALEFHRTQSRLASFEAITPTQARRAQTHTLLPSAQPSHTAQVKGAMQMSLTLCD